MPLPLGAAALAALRGAASPAGRKAIKEAAKKAAKKVKKATEKKPKLKTVQNRTRAALGYGNRAQMADTIAKKKPQAMAKAAKKKPAQRKDARSPAKKGK